MVHAGGLSEKSGRGHCVQVGQNVEIHTTLLGAVWSGVGSQIHVTAYPCHYVENCEVPIAHGDYHVHTATNAGCRDDHNDWTCHCSGSSCLELSASEWRRSHGRG